MNSTVVDPAHGHKTVNQIREQRRLLVLLVPIMRRQHNENRMVENPAHFLLAPSFARFSNHLSSIRDVNGEYK